MNKTRRFTYENTVKVDSIKYMHDYLGFMTIDTQHLMHEKYFQDTHKLIWIWMTYLQILEVRNVSIIRQVQQFLQILPMYVGKQERIE